MDELIPEFDWETVIAAPWRELAWIAVAGFFVTLVNGLVGTFLLLRRMALVGDAISHSVLPGIVIAFLIAHSLSGWVMFVGAVAAGLLTTFAIEFLSARSKLKEDAAIGITFTTLFAIGVVMVSTMVSGVHLDTECVLFGELGNVGAEPPVAFAGWTLPPEPVLKLGALAAAVVILIVAFYKELLVTSFDPGLSVSLGINARAVHYCLMTVLSIVVVASFESVGSILVVAMLILPAATALLLADRLPSVLWLVAAHALLSSVLGFHLAMLLDAGAGAAIVVAGFALFCAAWVFAPRHGLLPRWLRRRNRPAPAAVAASR